MIHPANETLTYAHTVLTNQEQRATLNFIDFEQGTLDVVRNITFVCEIGSSAVFKDLKARDPRSVPMTTVVHNDEIINMCILMKRCHGFRLSKLLIFCSGSAGSAFVGVDLASTRATTRCILA
jgi:hypothetical protein